jgi:hypothetical protein
MIVVVVAELMTVAPVPLKTVVGAVHLRLQRGLHLRLGPVARFEPAVMGLRMLLLRARYSLVLLLKVKRTLDGERCSAPLVNGLCVHCHREQERGSRGG